jgi:uncharacterized protein YjbI with pentapeptide repeats
MPDQNNSNSKQNISSQETTSKGNSIPTSADDKSEKRVENHEKNWSVFNAVLMAEEDAVAKRNKSIIKEIDEIMKPTIKVAASELPDIDDTTTQQNKSDYSTTISTGKQIERISDSRNSTKGSRKRIRHVSFLLPAATILLPVAATFLGVYITISRDQQKSIDERFLKTIELIGHSDPNVRSGAIIALKQVFQDSPNKKQESVELLANLVRINSPFFAKRSSVQVVPSDVAMALKVIKEADRKAKDRTPIDLPYIDLLSTAHKIKEKEPINLLHVNLFSIAQEVKEEEPINLSHVNLFNIDFSKGNLENISFNHSNLREADLKDAKLKGAYFKSAFLISTNMKNADLRGSHLEKANLGNANLEGSNLEHATFDKKYLKQIQRACNWHLAHYDPKIEDKLGITEMEDKKLDERSECRHFIP